MKYIKSKIIKETLKKLDSEEDREFLRNLTSNGIQYIENNFELRLLEMEKDIENIYLTGEQEYTIYQIPVNMEIYSRCSDQFFPLDKEDTEEKEENGKVDKKKVFLRRIYLDESYEKTEEFRGKSFLGSIIINGVSHSCNISVEQEKKYLWKEKEILNVFNKNDIEWQVVYTPYSRRFFNLYAEGVPENTKTKELKELKINYEEYGKNVYEDYFLVSNIQEKSILLDKAKGKSIDGNIVRYKIYSNDSKTDLIKINEGKIYGIERFQNFLHIYTDIEPEDEWKLWNIREIRSIGKYSDLSLMPKGNKKKIDLMGVLKKRSKSRTRSESEIFEIIKSYPEIKNLELAKIKLNEYVERPVSGYDSNWNFNETADIPRKKEDTLFLYFKYNKQDKYFYDEMSFLISSVAYKFPEYKVKGVLEWR
jgi:hypothetical protein